MSTNSEHSIQYIKDEDEQLNTYVEENTKYSCVHSELMNNSNEQNITLINYNDYIKVNDYKIYGHPCKWFLDYEQQYENCGVESAMNILSIAHKLEIENQNTFESMFTEEMRKEGLCDDEGKKGELDSLDGGTTAEKRKQILNKYGLESSVKTLTLEQIGEEIKQGKGIIIRVSARNLFPDSNLPDKLNHAISVIGVVYDENNQIYGFYICDTGKWGLRFITYQELENCYTGYVGQAVNVTNNEIRSWADDIDATGNDNDNVIKGNDGSNILKGEDGNDVLVGNEGKDTIYGGADDDVLIAGSAKKDSETNGVKVDLSNEELKVLKSIYQMKN